MNIRLLGAAVATAAIAASVPAIAGPLTYVGSWQVDQGPSWTTVPAGYTGQEAAAFLFGGNASDYRISTVDANPADVNYRNWVSTWGGACGGAFPCGTLSAENFKVSTGGLYETPGDTSSYVRDWAVGAQYTNYAFIGAPEPGAWALMMVGFGVLGLAARRRRGLAAA